MRVFVSHRVEGGGDDVDDEEEKDDDNKEGPSSAPDGSAPATAAVVARPSGGKDFSALLHSSAHQSAPEAIEAKKPPPLHRQQPKKGVRKWTLVIEGGLLVKHLDHESAKEVDGRLDDKLPILGCKGVEDDKTTQNKAEIPLRDQWRGTRENEKDIEPVSFTHLFDKMEVELKVFKETDKSEIAETSAITRSGLGAVPETPAPEVEADVKTFTWERAKSNTPDSHAFFIVHNEESEFKPMGGKVFKSIFKTDHIAAKVRLFRRQSGEGNYVPSEQICDAFFPTFIGKKAAAELKSKDKSSKSKKRKRSGGGDTIQRSTSSANLENEASNSSVSAMPPGKELAFASRQQSSAAATGGVAPASTKAVEEKDVHIPNTITMDEALHVIFFYIRTRNLQDATDLSIINNDETLSNLFGCSRMLFSAVSGLLIEKQLLVKVESNTQPIIFNYNMTMDGAEPLTKKRGVKTAGKSDTADMTTRRRSVNNDSDNVLSDSEQPKEAPHHQTMLSCDVDIEVPNLFHVRTRDILRRTKYREFEYTSNRIKALRSLMSTKVDEETAKLVLGDVVTGKGYAPYHKQALMAMAKGSHEGGEAQQAAWIDLRTTSLIEKLEEQSSLANGYWDVVNACQNICQEKK